MFALVRRCRFADWQVPSRLCKLAAAHVFGHAWLTLTTGGASGEAREAIGHLHVQRQEELHGGVLRLPGGVLLRAVVAEEGGPVRRGPSGVGRSLMRPAISLRGIGKKYRISPSRSSRLGEVLSFGRAKRSHEFWALQDVDLDIAPGTTLGVVGRNGAGKSTLLSIISGVLRPTTGEVEVRGRLSAIFGLGAGFNPLFTGRENAMLSGLILGIEHEEMLDRFAEIEAFADIGEFMAQPIKTYSSGMRSRLGFAVAVNVNADVLVLDEALSAGDAAFKKKAMRRMYDLRDSGTTVLFVSHSLGMVQKFCTDAVLLHKSRMVASGAPDEVVDRYRELLEKSDKPKDTSHAHRDRQLDYAIEHEDEEDLPASPNGSDDGGKRGPRQATGEAEIVRVELLDESREPVVEVPMGTGLTVRLHARYAQAV